MVVGVNTVELVARITFQFPSKTASFAVILTLHPAQG